MITELTDHPASAPLVPSRVDPEISGGHAGQFGSDATPAGTHVAGPTLGAIRRVALPGFGDRHAARRMCRAILAAFGHRILDTTGVEHLRAMRPGAPALIALNHNQRLESVLVPAWLIFLRSGHPISFFQDWNYQMVPGLAWLLRLNDPILVFRKPARPKFLDFLRRRWRPGVSSLNQARLRLARGETLGIFPEGRIHRCRRRLLPGLTGAAWLSVTTDVPILPVGLRYPTREDPRPIADWEPMIVEIGAPIHPERASVVAGAEPVLQMHHRLMRALARLSGKDWSPNSRPSDL